MHVILLDNRYGFDWRKNDRLGQEQWVWLDHALGRSVERQAELTVIGAGIQMLPYKPKFMYVETFEWPNKSRIYELLKKHEVSNAVFISGDVHMGQIYQNRCSSLTGQQNLLEVCSSGLTHAVSFYVPFSARNFNLFGADFWKLSEPWVERNYGVLEISSDLVFSAKVKDSRG